MQIIRDSKHALSQMEVHKKLGSICDRVTVYRVLGRLLEDGHVHRVVDTDGVVKYAACHTCQEKHNHHHVHFSCKQCKELSCLESKVIQVELAENYSIDDFQVLVTGICPACQSKA